MLIRPGAYTFPGLSPDGRHLAINVSDGGVFRTEIDDLRRPDEPPLRPPFVPGSMSPVWHPNGFLIVGGPQGMSWMNPLTGAFVAAGAGAWCSQVARRWRQ